MSQIPVQVLLNQFSKLFRFQNQAFRTKAEDPALNFFQAGHPESDFEFAVRKLGYFLALVPDLFSHPPGPPGRDSDFHGMEIIMHNLKTVAHEIIQSSHAKAPRTQRETWA